MTIILGLGADVSILLFTMVLVGSFLLLIWRLKKKKSWNTGHLSSLFAKLMWFQILKVIWARYAHMINIIGIFMMSILPWFFQMDNQPFYRLSYLLSCVISSPLFLDTLVRGYFMNIFSFPSKCII